MTKSSKPDKIQDMPVPQAEPKGIDARFNADRAAEDEGRKAREKAVANGGKIEETGGPKGLEPTRYGDWEKAGRCIDF